jgi:membrane protein YdbS with pleckstrin-like domain
MTQANLPPGGKVPPPHPDPDVSAADDTQIIYYDGSPKLRGELGLLFTWFLIGVVIVAVPILILYFGGQISRWFVVLGALIAIGCWFMPGLLVRREHFRITNYRIDMERGLLFKDLETLELWHVEDLSLRQSPIDRIFNVGTITVTSRDETNPRLLLRSVAHPREILETLKTRVISVKRQQGVLKVDPG